MTSPPDATSILWCGRFSRADGYGTVSRNHLLGLVDVGAPVAALDLDLMQIVGPECGAGLNVRSTATGSVVSAEDPARNVAVVFHERPDMYERVRVDGRARLIGHSVFETDGLPPGWVEPLVSADELWVASEFNRRSFTAAGVPPFLLNKITHSLDTKAYRGSIGEIRFVPEESCQFLSVCSSLERRDLGLLFRSFLRAFDPDDEVYFVVKVRDSLQTVEAAQALLDQAVLTVGGRSAITASKIRILAADMGAEEMIRLYAGCDVYVSPERANGWDMPTMEAMASGKLTIGANTGGATEYATDDVSIRIPVDQDVRIPLPTGKPHGLYTAQWWPGLNEDDVVNALRTAYLKPELRRSIGARAQAFVREQFDSSVVAQRIVDRVTPLSSTEVRSTKPALAVISRKSRAWREVDEQREDMTEAVLAYALMSAGSGALDRGRSLALYRQANDMRGVMRDAATGPIARALGDAVSTSKNQPLRKSVALTRLGAAVVEATGSASRRRSMTTLGRGVFEMSAGRYEAGKFPADSIDARRAACGRFPVIPVRAGERERLGQLRNRYHGERCFILGNGPSLNRTDLTKLQSEYTFGVNKIYMLYDRIDWRPTFYSLLDWRVGPEIAPHVDLLDESMKFLPNRFRGFFPDDERTNWYTTRPVLDDIENQFVADISDGIPSRGTIIVTAIQIAFHLGFREIYLIGVDASYQIPDTVKQSGPDRHGTGVRLNLESTADDDPNHFDSRYFGKGARWHDPNVDEMVRMFRIMRKGVELHGGQLRNATVGGQLEVLQRVDYDSLF